MDQHFFLPAPSGAASTASAAHDSRSQYSSHFPSIFSRASKAPPALTRQTAASKPSTPRLAYNILSGYRASITNHTPRPYEQRSRAPSSTRSVIDPAAQPISVPPLTTTGLHHYGDVHVAPSYSPFPDLHRERLRRRFDGSSVEELVLGQEYQATRSRETRRRTRRKHGVWSRVSSSNPTVRSKAILSAVFAGTLLASLTVYLALAVTGTGTGIMFHILFILFILGLTALFAHSVLMMCLLLISSPKSRRHRHGHHHRQAHTDPLEQPAPKDDEPLTPTSPIPIIMPAHEDDVDEEAALDTVDHYASEKASSVLRPPPPVYGVWRDSAKLNPDWVHWQPLPPSPLTPTYEEALHSVQTAVGYRPPSYVSDASVHPLERGRMRGLMAHPSANIHVNSS